MLNGLMLLVQEGTRITITDTADKLDISSESACSTIHEGLGHQNLCKADAKAVQR